MLEPKAPSDGHSIEIDELELGKETLEVLSEGDAQGVGGGGALGFQTDNQPTCVPKIGGGCHSGGCETQKCKAGETDYFCVVGNRA